MEWNEVTGFFPAVMDIAATPILCYLPVVSIRQDVYQKSDHIRFEFM
jgi:hypothetical protein